MSKTPIHATPLTEQEKEGIFGNPKYATADGMLKDYITAFVKKNRLQGYIAPQRRWIMLLITAVYSLILVLDLLHLFFYHDAFFVNGLVLVAATVAYGIVLSRFSVGRWLMGEVKRRPQDDLDNILASQVSGTGSGILVRIAEFAIPLVVAVACCAAFWRPHIIFERNNSILGGYSIRYYTLAFDNDSYIVLPESYNGLPVNEIRGSTFTNLPVRSIVLPSSIKEIRGNTFENCTQLRSIEIPEGVTRIGGSAFSGCTALHAVSLPHSLTEIGGSAFRECGALADISLWETSLERIGTSAFRGCKNLQRVELPPTTRTLGDSVFRECRQLKSILLPEEAFMGQKVFVDTPFVEIQRYKANKGN